jgi:copper chaperone CopZ
MAALALAATAAAAQPQAAQQTTITVPDLHCRGCVKKVADKLHAVPGVGTVQASLEARILVVTPRPQAVISPRLLWEAVEAAGKRPARLEGPHGSFAAKPRP